MINFLLKILGNAVFFMIWILIGLLFFLIVVWIIRTYFAVIRVEGQSMLPTLKHGDRVLVWRHVPHTWLRPGQIVVLDIKGLETSALPMIDSDRASTATFAPNDVLYIKRLVAMAGESYQATIPIPPGYCFVCGDNAAHSNDSRHWGPVSYKRIRGVAIRRLASQPAIKTHEPLNSAKNYASLIGKPMLDFTATTLDGKTVTLNDYVGKIFTLVLLSADTSESRDVLRAYKTVDAEIKAARKIVFVNIGTKDETHQWIKEMEGSGVKIPILFAEKTNFLNYDHHILKLPFFFIVDAKGQVQAQGYATTDYSPLLMEF